MTVLIVDDEPEIRQFLRWDFEDEGFLILEAESGHHALEVLSENPDIDAVLSDTKMPQGDGLSLIQNLKDENIQTPVILMSGHFELSNAELKKRGAFATVDKPICDSHALFQLVRKACQIQKRVAI